MEFLIYLKREKGLSMSTIEYLSKKYGEEISENQARKIMEVLELFAKLKIDTKYINQHPEIFSLADIGDEDEYQATIEYIKKRVSRKKLIEINLHIILAAREIVKNKKEENADRIIALLEREGIADIVLDKSLKNRRILYATEYTTIAGNIRILKNEKGYRALIRNSPQIVYKATPKELEKIILEIRKKEQQDKQDDADLEQEIIEDTQSIDNQIEKERNEIENEDATDGYAETHNGYIKLASEEQAQYIMEVFKRYEIPYTLILSCPYILKRPKLSEVERILEVLFMKNVNMRIVQDCPEILELGKSKDILEIINELNRQNLNLTILDTCPYILLKSNPGKIKAVVDTLEKNHISKNLIYSCPEILISGNTKILLEIGNEMIETTPDINIMLDVAPYVFVERVHNYSMMLERLEDKTEMFMRKNLSNTDSIVVVRNIDEAQKIINVFKEQKLDTDILKSSPQILNRSTAKQIKEVTAELDKQGFDRSIINDDPTILMFASSNIIKETTAALKVKAPNTYKTLISQAPNIYANSDAEKINNVYAILAVSKLSSKVVENYPNILTRENEHEIGAIVATLTNAGFTKEQIETCPQLLSDGKSKYVERNVQILERNYLSIPLSNIYGKRSQNVENNVYTFIENGMYMHIEKQPEMLAINDKKVRQYINLAKKYNIQLEILDNDDLNDKKFNLSYFKMSEQELIDTYGMDKQIIERERERVERQRDKKIKNRMLFNSVYPMLEQEVSSELAEYSNDKVSYVVNERIIAKQRIIRDVYLKLEDVAERDGKAAIKSIDMEQTIQNVTTKILQEKSVKRISLEQTEKKVSKAKTIKARGEIV